MIVIKVFLPYSIRNKAIPCFYRLGSNRVSILHRRTWDISRLIELRWSWPAFRWFLVLSYILPSKARVRLSCPFRRSINAMLCRRTRRDFQSTNIIVPCLLHLGVLADVVYSSRHDARIFMHKSPFTQLAHYPAASLKIVLGKSAFLHHKIRVYIGGIVVHMGDDGRCQPVGHHRTALSAAFHGSFARVVVGVEMQFSIIVNASQPVFLVPNHRTEALRFLVVDRVSVAVILVSSGFRFAHLHDFTWSVRVGRVVVAVVQRIALLHPAGEVV
ncbi:Uncharacterised protein [Candidatus Ornithobacterium hominis]|uniref:Uncharacterized protein n=1 Tax=Candidatus Ornithobacterium hominis TaxID=2497989 RepID=A0A383U3A1_9FLAO|nr:Uncharacterised protein [Candidatus Ornithobacterium hominis]